MAIEIKELNVRLIIDSESDGNSSEVDFGACSEVSDKDVVVERTVKEVLRILKEKQER